jgi:hypothetical protein
MFAAGGTLLIILGFSALIAFRLEIGVIDTLFLVGTLLLGWQLRNNIRAYRSKHRVKFDRDDSRVAGHVRSTPINALIKR